MPPVVDGTNVAAGKPATASTFQPDSVGCPCPAGNAVDGSFDTRWASDRADRQWLQVDLGERTAFDHAQLAREAAYAKGYTLQTSDNAQDRTTVHTVTGGDGGIDDIKVSGEARYIRVNTSERGTPWGYSLYEFGVYRS